MTGGRVKFRLLGPLEVRRDGVTVRLGGPRERAVLAALLLRANQVASIGYLIDAVWERSPASPETNLRTYISALRRRLDPDRFVTRSGGYLLEVRPGELDLAGFEEASARGREALRRGNLPDAMGAFEEALGHWREEPLAGMSYGATLHAEVAQLTARRLDAIEGCALAKLGSGAAQDVVDELPRFVAQYPLREELWALLIQAQYRTGRRAEALETYARARTRLSEALGVEPGSRLRDLQATILRGEPDDEGADPRSHKPAQLPADLTTFTGRSAELDQLTALLADGAPRTTVVITAIDGMAGIGKTALATRLAHQIRGRFPDGQLFLDLHGHTEGIDPVASTDALDRLLRTLGVPDQQIPAGLDDRAALYRSVLAEQQALILLDNALTEEQVRPLLPASAGCAVLITSRRRLAGLDSAVPVSLDVLPGDDAIDLFCRIAGPVDPEGVQDVVQLCGYLPLAIRIAAARLRSRPGWPLAHLADRLHDEHRRLAELQVGERSVATAFGLSYRLLGTGEQRAFRLLGLPPGADIDLHATAALLDLPAHSAGEVLDHLVDAHMLSEHQPGRYRFHDLLRDYAIRSGADEEPEVSRDRALTRLFDHYVGSATLAMDAVYPHDSDSRTSIDTTGGRRFGDPAAATEWLDAELTNLFATASYAADNGRPAHTVLLSRILYRHLRTRGYYAQAEQLHSHAGRAARALGDHRGELEALRGIADSYFLTGRYHDAQATFQRALDVARGAGIVDGEGTALRGLGTLHREAGRLPEADECYRLALDAAHRAGDRNGERHAVLCLGHVRLLTGDHQPAIEAYRRSLDISVELGDRIGQAEAIGSLAVIHRRTGDDEKALDCYQQALRLGRDAGDRRSEIHALHGLGLVHEHTGDHDRALDCHREGLQIARITGDLKWRFEAHHGIGRALSAQGRCAEALREHGIALGLAHDLGFPNGRARVLHSMGLTEVELGHPDRARSYWVEALALFTELGAPEADQVAQRLHQLALPDTPGSQAARSGVS